jgi:hypothetical protein
MMTASWSESYCNAPSVQATASTRRTTQLACLSSGSRAMTSCYSCCLVGERHERRVQRASGTAADRLFWVTITVACGSLGRVRGRRCRLVTSLAKCYGYLAKARNDLDAYYQYYRLMMVGSPALVGVVPGLGKSAGFFDHAIRLDNPREDELSAAIAD